MSASSADDAFIAEALPAFVSEAREQVAQIEQLLLRLEDAPQDRELLDALFRCAHTVKGSAGIFGLGAIVAFTHHVETLLDRMREGQLALTPALGTLLLSANDEIAALVRRAQSGAAEEPRAARSRDAIVVRLQEACDSAILAAPPAPAGGAAAGMALQAWRIFVRFGPDTFRNGMDPLALLNYLRGMGELDSLVCDVSGLPPLAAMDPESCFLALRFTLATSAGREAIEAAFSFVRDDCELDISPLQAASPVPATGVAAPAGRAATPDRAGGAGEESRFIRVQADRLDDVINLLGELVISGAGATLLARQAAQGALVEANQQTMRLIEQIRDATLQLRMVPIGETFTRFRRVVRDTAGELGKDVAFEIVGGETELDKSVVERIADPLMHLVRNALDHGLETPAQRIAGGKSAQGRLTLAACHESGNILIRISDDGRGIDRARVLERARQRGMVAPGETPADADLLELIFAAGFSTAQEVTNLSGRGVGMDVVRRNIEALRGSVSIASVQGTGTTIEIRLPLTLAMIDGFLVAVGPSKFIFPLDAVVEVIERGAGASGTARQGTGTVPIRGGLLPVMDLRTLYALDSPAPERASIVVVRSGERRFGVLVDTLMGQHQTVIKPLARMLRSLRGISGSSILGTGEVALIFDVHSMSRLASQPASVSPATLQPAQV